MVADELKFSAKELVRYATNNNKPYYTESKGDGKEISDAEAYANDLLLLIADRRFCRVIVSLRPSLRWRSFMRWAKQRSTGFGSKPSPGTSLMRR